MTRRKKNYSKTQNRKSKQREAITHGSFAHRVVKHRRLAIWAITLGILCVVLTTAWVWVNKQKELSQIYLQPATTEKNTSAQPLPRSGYRTGKPINKIDPTSGKRIVSGITSNYKGYTIGHCCEYNRQQWMELDSNKKDAFVRKILG